jgi:SNF2 family DNA or RNA helicase
MGAENLLSESFLAKAAGWEAMKQARLYLSGDGVVSSDWLPPVLNGVVQAGETIYRAGLVIKSDKDIENLCTCRPSREWGTICAHSVAVGLHHLQKKGTTEKAPPESGRSDPAVDLVATGSQERASGHILRRALPGEPGEPLQLHLIWPPQLEQVLRRDRVMMCLEATVRGARRPVQSLPGQQMYSLGPEDVALLDELESLVGGEPAAAWMLSVRDLARLLPALVGHPRMTAGKKSSVEITDAPWAPEVQAHLERTGQLVLSPKGSGKIPVVLPGGWIYRAGVFQPFGLPASCADIFLGPVRLSRPEVPLFLQRDWPVLVASGKVTADFSLDDFVLETPQPAFHLHLAGGLAMLEARLKCFYGPHAVTPSGGSGPAAEPALFWPDQACPTRYFARDLSAERVAVGRLIRAGFRGPDKQEAWHLDGQEAVLDFFARDLGRLEREWKVTFEERLQRSAERNLDRVEPRFRVTSSGVQWFDLSIAYGSTAGLTLRPAEVQRLLRSGHSHARLPNGRIALVDTDAVAELQEVLRDSAPRQHEQGYRLDAAQAAFLETTVHDLGWKLTASATGSLKILAQGGPGQLSCPALGALDGLLRPYQKQGVAWIHFLAEHNFGGILADEMGLGKTVQALAFVQSRREQARQEGRESPGPSLVVCPTSLITNWVAEAGRFTPGLKVLALHGPDRQASILQVPQCDLAVTSYALIRRDAERYQDWTFGTVILDEAQHIKNRQTQNAQAVKGIRSHHRLVLTGTPLENSVEDLWSIFDFLMPGYLGPAREFHERYELPITRDRCPRTQARLARRVRPFLLRRLKRDVARDLPSKVEQTVFCELTTTQREAYEQVLQAGWQEICRSTGGNPAESRMLVLTTLLRLRQICCDLRLLKLTDTTPENASAKLDLFGELLEEVLDGGHRVLVFSQFVQMLSLVGEKLDAENIPYCCLTGSTRDRAAEVGRFQRRADIPVFLISLKAGGVGLNLTGADTVVHFDPWWNPAVEAQATDRAHRLGQTRAVTSYKLITRGTVEEKILALQTRKRELIGALWGGEEDVATALTWEEIQGLLAP